MRSAVLFLAAVAFMNFPAACKAETPVNWSIAIHGGAGGSPDKWDNIKKQARTAGLKKALNAGKLVLSQGGAAIDAVEAAIRVLEDDASFNAGRGAVLTEDGTVEMDASIMDGRTLACGAVAGVTRTKNPIGLARLVMTKTKHVLLAGTGANEFAQEQGVTLVRPDYFKTSFDNSYKRGDQSRTQTGDNEPHFGTVGCVAFDQQGNLAAGTSTGGTAQKLPGRVGDSPIIGAGTYAANHSCAVSGTGIGEEYIRRSVAYDVAAQMRYANRPLHAAVTTVMNERLERGVGGLIAVSHAGEIVMKHNTPGMSCAAADSNGRFETFLSLPNDRESDTATNQAIPDDAKSKISAIIHQQATDWNTGDIDAFMQPYWKSNALTFSSGGKITRGWDATLAGYKKRYPDKTAMGRTTFSQLEFLRLDDKAMQVIGTWQLDREEDPIGGKFSLVFKRFDEGWKIVHDHTSLLKSE
jgi:beta-aspartyl-peptidase (threonine type)